MTYWICACRHYHELPKTDICLRCGMPVTRRSGSGPEAAPKKI